MVGMDYVGKLNKIEGKRLVTFTVDEDIDIAELSRINDKKGIKARITFDDNRHISSSQRKKIYAMIGDIAKHTGDSPEYIKEWMKYYFIAEQDEDYFSLATTDMTTAKAFISYLIEFCFKWDIPFYKKGIEMTDDITNYLYLCLKYRKCAICGLKADLDHWDAVGMAGYKNVDNTTKRLIALCREHHTERHTMGRELFEERYHVTGIKLNAQGLEDCGIKRHGTWERYEITK